MQTWLPWRRTRGSLRSSSCLGRKPSRAPQLEETPETPPSSRAEGLLFLHGLEEMELDYRHSIYLDHPEWIVLSSVLILSYGNAEDIRGKMKANMASRNYPQAA